MITADLNIRRALAALAIAAAFCGTISYADPAMRIDAGGTIEIDDLSVPLPELLSDGSKQVLMRTQPTEGPGAPVPLPSDIDDMAELRSVYNRNLQPNVDHMRSRKTSCRRGGTRLLRTFSSPSHRCVARSHHAPGQRAPRRTSFWSRLLVSG
jgi:hypothetical protein